MARKFYSYYCYVVEDGVKIRPYSKGYIVGQSINDVKRRLNRINAEHNSKPQNRNRKISIHSVKLDRKTTREWRMLGRL